MMQHKPSQGRQRPPSRHTLFVLGMVGVTILCFSVSMLALRASTGNARAANFIVSGTLSSSPASGPVGTTISVSGSGWPESDGTTVNFGYLVASTCSLVTDSQPGNMISGAFQGWFRWPQGTSLGPYSVCAMISGTSYTASSFDLLSTASPQVSISPSTLQEREQATATASNYYPAGTTVTFYWATTSNKVEFTLSTTISASNGTAIMGFSVPITSLTSGQYLIEAVGGGGQPSALFSSSNFTYSAPVVPPSPTPSPKPSPSPVLSPTPTQNPTPIASPTTSASATPTVGASTTPGVTPTRSGTGTGTPTQVTNTTPTPVTSTTGTNGNSNTTPTGQSSGNSLLIAGMIGALALLIVAATFVMVLRRRKGGQLARSGDPLPPSNPGVAGQQYAQYAPGGMAGQLGMPGPYPMPGMMNASANVVTPVPQALAAAQPVPVPALVGSGYMGANDQNNIAATPTQAPLAYRSLLKPLTPPPQNDPTALQGGNGAMPSAADPALDALRRQAQAGLFVPPKPRQDGWNQ